MRLARPNEYHPILACWAYKGCRDAEAVRANLRYTTVDEAVYFQNLPIQDTARFDDVLRITQEEDSSGRFGVVLEYDNYQDFTQVRLLDGKVLSESQWPDWDRNPQDPDSESGPEDAIRHALKKAREYVEKGGA